MSTVSVGASADKGLLETLADEGGGRYYHTDIRENLPRIFAQEVFLSAKSYLVNEDFVPTAASDHPAIAALAGKSLPVLHGYIATTQKQGANVLLASHNNDPIIALWQYGLGKTAAFTSDVKNLWTGEYALWEDYPTLWKNLIESTFSQENSDKISAYAALEDGRAVITYHTQDYSSSTKVTAVYTSESGETKELELMPKTPGIFFGELPEDLAPGIYSVNVRQTDEKGVNYSANTVLANPFSKEYRFEKDTDSFDRFVEQMQGIAITEPGQVFDTTLSGVKTMQDLTVPFLFIAWLLFIADIALRRLALYDKIILSASRPKLVCRIKKATKDRKNGAKEQKTKKNLQNSPNTRQKDIEKTQKRGYNKKESALDTQALLKKQNELRKSGKP